MKPLPKPSLMMLWLARLYTAWVLGFDLVRLISYTYEPDSVSVVNPATNSGVSTVITHHGPTLSLFLNVVLFACLLGGLFMLYRKPVRVMVGAVAIYVSSTNLYGIFHLFYMLMMANSISTAFLHGKLPVILTLSICNIGWQLLNIWLAFQPPDRANTIDRGSLLASSRRLLG